MSLESLKNRLPDYARDLKLNLGSLATEPGLTEQQRAGTFVASALAAREPSTIRAILAEFGPRLSPEALTAAKAAAAIMGMNNVFYRFLHLTKNEKYRTLPARLRMNVIRSHGVDQQDFELWCTAVSAINGCGACVDSHEHTLREKGMSEETILAAVRVASIAHAIASVFNAETAAAEATA